MDYGFFGFILGLYRRINCKRCSSTHTHITSKGSLGLCSYEIDAQCRMDSQTGGIFGIFGFLVSMAGVLYAAVNHKKIRCKCCGKNLDMSVDVDSTEALAETRSDPKIQVDLEEKEVKRKSYRKDRVVPAPPPPPEEL